MSKPSSYWEIHPMLLWHRGSWHPILPAGGGLCDSHQGWQGPGAGRKGEPLKPGKNQLDRSFLEMENSYKESKISKELKHVDGSVSHKNEEQHQSNLETWRKPRNQQ